MLLCDYRIMIIKNSIILLLLTIFALTGFSQNQNGKQAYRLILTDGSYELVTKHEIIGGRVRYFSAERNDWEELPSSLVDLKATEEFAKNESSRIANHKKEALDRAATERAAEAARMPEIAPGIQLPAQGGVYLLDVYSPYPSLYRLNQNGADLKKNTKNNILRAAINPIAGSRQTVELKGLNAAIQSHTAAPDLYFSIDPEDPAMEYAAHTAKDHLRIVHCEEKKESRIVTAIDIAVYGKVKQSAHYVDAKIEPVSDYWVRITPLNPLPPGEYAIVEYDAKGAANQFVWDFGYDPSAPQNASSVGQSESKDVPALIQKQSK
jgi:hypothetical protein